MICLLRKSIELLRDAPVLWLPYLVAELMSIGLWRLWGVVRTSIFHWFTMHQSVLGGETPVPSTDYSALANASLVAIPIGFVTVFAIAFLFVVAFMTTERMVDAINRKQKMDARGILAGLAQRWGRILLFSLLCLTTFGFFAVGAAALLLLILRLAHRPFLPVPPIFELGLLPIFVGCATWVLMPMAIRLLRADKTVVPSRTRNFGAATAALVVEAGALLGEILSKAEETVQLETQLEWSMLRTFNAVVANAPDVLLFVVVALLAADYSLGTEGAGRPKVRALLRTLMPLHYREMKDPE